MSDFRKLATPAVYHPGLPPELDQHSPAGSVVMPPVAVHVIVLDGLPPSNNDLWVPVRAKGRVRLVASKVYVAWKERTLLALKSQAGLHPFSGPVEWKATFWVATIASDCTNRGKALEDALKGFAWHDDSQVVRATCEKALADPDTKTVVTVWPIEAGRCDPRLEARIRASRHDPNNPQRRERPR